MTNEFCRRDSCFAEQFTGGTCIAPTACLLTSGYGAVIVSADVLGGASTWTRTVVYGHGEHMRGIYQLQDPHCFSTSLCYAIGTQGDLLISTDPFGSDPASWEVFHVPGVKSSQYASADVQLSCADQNDCYVLYGTRRVIHARVDGTSLQPPAGSPNG